MTSDFKIYLSLKTYLLNFVSTVFALCEPNISTAHYLFLNYSGYVIKFFTDKFAYLQVMF